MESLRKQTYKNIKVYIHDDGSSDKTLDIIKEYVEHKRGTIEFELFSKKSLRYPMCFINTLLEIPKADYYAFCDQDDVWNEDKIHLPDKPHVPVGGVSEGKCTICNRMLAQIIINDQHVLSFVHKILAHCASGIRSNIL